MVFSFLEYLFFVLEIFAFLYYANEGSDDVIDRFTTELEYLQKYWSSDLQTWHQKCTSHKKQNDIYYIVAMATPLVPVSFCEKPNVPVCNLFEWNQERTGGLPRHRPGSHIVLTLPIRLLGVDDPCVRQNLGILVVIKTGPAA